MVLECKSNSDEDNARGSEKVRQNVVRKLALGMVTVDKGNTVSSHRAEDKRKGEDGYCQNGS